MSNQQTLRQLLALDNRIKQIESSLSSINPNFKLTAASNNNNELKVLKDEIEQLKKSNELKVLKDEIEKLKKAPQQPTNSNELKVLKDEIEKLKKTSQTTNPNEIRVLREEIEKLKKNNKEIADIDKMIKNNFDETNKKFELVNKAVTSLDENLEKANKIEKDVQELKTKFK